MSHATQPDGLLLLLTLVSVYVFLHAEERRIFWTPAATLALATASVLKPTAFLTILPVWLFVAWRSRRKVACIAALVFVAIIVSSWGAYDRALLLSQAPDWYRANMRWFAAPLRSALDPTLYANLGIRLFLLLLPPFVIVLVILTISKRSLRIQVDPIWWWWLAGGALSILAFGQLNNVHHYYQLLLVPALAAVAAYAFPARESGRLAGYALTAVVVGGSLSAAVLDAGNPIRYAAGTALAEASTDSRPVVVVSLQGDARWYPTVLYYANRNGWNLPLDVSAARIAALPGPTPCVMVVVRDGPVQPIPNGWRPIASTAAYLLARRNGQECQ